jgi:hypothetical protein
MEQAVTRNRAEARATGVGAAWGLLVTAALLRSR